MKITRVVLSLAILFTTAGCQSRNINDNLVVYVTNYPLKYIVESIGQDLIDTHTTYDNLDTYDPNNDINDFVYVAQDYNNVTLEEDKIKRILDSDLFIFSQLAQEKEAVLQVIESQNSEDLNLYDISEFFKSDTTNNSYPLVYNSKIVAQDIRDLTEMNPKNNYDYFWISPTDMLIVSGLIKDLLIEKMPNKESSLTANYEKLKYKLLLLSSNLEKIQKETANNTIVSDSTLLNGLDYYFIENITTDQTTTSEYENATQAEYLSALSEYITIKKDKVLSTKVSNNAFYFNPLFTLTAEDYNSGKDFENIMLNNYLILESVLKG